LPVVEDARLRLGSDWAGQRRHRIERMAARPPRRDLQDSLALNPCAADLRRTVVAKANVFKSPRASPAVQVRTPKMFDAALQRLKLETKCGSS
jgi:hypothetical protein